MERQAVFQGVFQLQGMHRLRAHTLIVVVVLVQLPDAAHIRRHRLVQRQRLLQKAVVLSGVQDIGVLGQTQLQLRHLAQGGDPGGNTQHVGMEPGTQRAAADYHHDSSLPAAPKDPQGLFQQHGSGIVADEPAHGQAHRHGHSLVERAVLEPSPDQLIEDHTAPQGCQRRHHALEHRPQPAGRHDVAGALAAAAAVEEICQDQQHHARQGVEAHQAAVFQGHVYQFPGEEGLSIHRDRHILTDIVHVDVPQQVHRGREALQHAGVDVLHTHEKARGDAGDQIVQQHLQEMQQEVDGRQGQEIAG